MDLSINELKQEIQALTQANAALMSERQEYFSAKQSLNRMSTRLRKLCKRLAPTSEVVIEMQSIADEIRKLAKQAASTTHDEV